MFYQFTIIFNWLIQITCKNNLLQSSFSLFLKNFTWKMEFESPPINYFLWDLINQIPADWFFAIFYIIKIINPRSSEIQFTGVGVNFLHKKFLNYWSKEKRKFKICFKKTSDSAIPEKQKFYLQLFSNKTHRKKLKQFPPRQF